MWREPWFWLAAVLVLAAAAAEVVLFVAAILRIIRSGESSTAKAIWVLICLCFPILGSIVALAAVRRPPFSS